MGDAYRAPSIEHTTDDGLADLMASFQSSLQASQQLNNEAAAKFQKLQHYLVGRGGAAAGGAGGGSVGEKTPPTPSFSHLPLSAQQDAHQFTCLSVVDPVRPEDLSVAPVRKISFFKVDSSPRISPLETTTTTPTTTMPSPRGVAAAAAVVAAPSILKTSSAVVRAKTEKRFAELFPDDDSDSSDFDDRPDVESGGGPSGSKSSRVPRLTAWILNRAGEFGPSSAPGHDAVDEDGTVVSPEEEYDRETARESRRTKSGIEDSVMDRARVVSYVEVSAREKQDVFQLPAVRRSMRKLAEGDILMSDYVLRLSSKFMQMAPSRASLLHIGWDSMQEGCNEKSLMDEMDYISPAFGKMARFRYTKGMFFFNLFTGFCEVAFYIVYMRRNGADAISIIALLSNLIFVLSNAVFCAGYVFKPHHLSAHTLIDNLRLTGISYLRLHGLDVLAVAQHRMAREDGKDVDPVADLALFRKKIVSKVFIESYTLHFLINLIPCLVSALSTTAHSFERGDWIFGCLAAGAIWSKAVTAFCLGHIAFVVRLSQRLSEFECRRVEADIRTVFPSMTHRITPRFKSLLHEVHMAGNRCHALYYAISPVIVLNILMLVTAVCVGSFLDTPCIPTWCFFVAFQPIITCIVWVHFSALINVAIERDIDQDVVEMNIRLTFSNTHVPNWLLQQMICIERLDGRAVSLPGGLPATVEMSRQMLGSFFTVCIVLAPYLVSIWSKLSSELLCQAEISA